MERIGVLGGTFDPPHLGHLWLAETARQQLELQKVLFMPVGDPPHKIGQPCSSVRHRLAMTGLAIAGHPSFILDDTDAVRAPPHYTATLLPLLKTAFPDAAFWLAVGSDSLRDLPAWHQPREVIRQCRLAVLSRPGVVIDWVTLSLAVPGVDAAVDLLTGPTLNLSSSEIRGWIAPGRSLRYLVPPAVRQYIAQTGLYRPSAPGQAS